MAIQLPSALELDDDGLPVGGSNIPAFWVEGTDFGSYLRELREQQRWSTRRAADEFGVSQAYISKIEHQERKRPPNMELVRQVARVYGVEIGTVMDHAGFRFDVPPSVGLRLDRRRAFFRLMDDERFRPPGYDDRDSRYLSRFVQDLILDVAINVARAVEDGDLDFEAWLSKEGE